MQGVGDEGVTQGMHVGVAIWVGTAPTITPSMRGLQAILMPTLVYSTPQFYKLQSGSTVW